MEEANASDLGLFTANFGNLNTEQVTNHVLRYFNLAIFRITSVAYSQILIELKFIAISASRNCLAYGLAEHIRSSFETDMSIYNLGFE